MGERKMKKILAILLTIVVVFSIFSIFVPQVKALTTFTDFESGLGNWVPFTEGIPTAFMQLSTAYSHSSSHSLEQYSSSISPDGSVAGIRLPVTSISDQYELNAWAYVTERNDADSQSLFGFVYDSEFVSWNPWGSSSSYVYVRQSEGYEVKGDYNNPVPYGLTLNTWHQVNVTVYTNSGNVSIWLDSDLIVDNWPAFNAGDIPDFYGIDCSANDYGNFVIHQYIDDIYTSEIPSVGGFYISVDKFSLLAPYLALVSTIILAVSISVAYIKRRKKQ